MGRPRIVLLNASYETDDTRRNFSREVDASLVEFVPHHGDLPTDTDIDGAIITGSRASVYWAEPWIDATKAWVRRQAGDGLPMLGVCWGHQLLAEALGGAVRDMGGYEIGYRTVLHDGRSDLFSGIDREFTAFQTHSDEVITSPPDAEIVAESDVSIQAFDGPNYWGVQFHPEYDMVTAKTVTEQKDDLEADRKAEALNSITEANYRKAAQAAIVFENFVQSVEDARSSD